MPAASYKKDMVGRTRISDRLDIEYLPEIRFLGIVLRFSQKKRCFIYKLITQNNTILPKPKIQGAYLPDPSLTTSMILKWGRRREVKWLIFIWPDDVCVYIWFSMHFMPRDLFREPMNCQLGNSKGMNENEIALFTILRKVWSEKKSTLQNHQVYCTYFNGNTRPNLILMFNGWIVIQNICK